VLRWAENPRNRLAGFRVAQLVPGLGAATAQRLLDAMEAAADPTGELQRFVPPAAAKLEWQTLAKLIADLRSSVSAWPEDIQLVSLWYQPHLERRHDDARIRQADLVQCGWPTRRHRGSSS